MFFLVIGFIGVEMEWIKQFELFLFDFDGLLVDTESIHFQAYIEMCAARGYTLGWNFTQFSEAAHHKGTGLRDRVYADLPALYEEEPDWSILYQEKKDQFLNLIERDGAQLMTGAAELLNALEEQNITRCVVTHSANELISKIRRKNPILDSIPYWITREDYANPKPSPECYQIAIQRYAQPGDRIIGFEDSPRGWNALNMTSALPVLICPPDSTYLPKFLEEGVCYYPTLSAISQPPSQR
jgi:HAD superfamily hydrolase (TIGR01509 family)